ncbi:MAG: class I SAM-dependent methyltransferase [Ktedonobacteraceae bacterium]
MEDCEHGQALASGKEFMNTYDVIAPFYDVEHAHFSEDLDMYQNFAESCSGTILELACGSGRVLLPLAQAGYDVVGIDTSAPMLALAQQRVQEMRTPIHCELLQQDMVTMQLGRRFRMAFIALGSFAHMITRKEQQQALANIRTHLSTGGLFLIDISNADAHYMEDLSGQVLHQGTWQRDDGTMLTHFVSPASSPTKHLLELTHFYDQHKQGGIVERTTTTTHLYLFARSEMELLLEQAGFTVKDVYGDYDLGPCLLDSPRMIFVTEAH